MAIMTMSLDTVEDSPLHLAPGQAVTIMRMLLNTVGDSPLPLALNIERKLSYVFVFPD